MKHIYQNVDGWFSFPKFYSKIVEIMPDGARLVEIGTYKGKSFSYLVVEAINSGKKFDIVGIDACPDGWGVEEGFNETMKGLEGNFRTLFGGDSFDRAKDFEIESIDFLFIDANHTYDFVKKDISYFLPKMKKGGIISGHDYNDCHEGVIRAVNEAFGDRVIYDKEEDVWQVQL